MEYIKKKELFKKLFGNAVFASLSIAVLLNLIIEGLGRGKVFGGFEFLMTNPKAFFYNIFLVFFTLSVSLLVRRRIFMYVLISSLWLALGITNGVILSFRMTPFTVSDLALLENGISILPNYMTVSQMLLTGFSLVFGIALFVLAFFFAPKRRGKMHYKWNITLILIVSVSFFSLTNAGINNRWLSSYFNNLGYAYKDYGVPYCFLSTWLNKGIPVPVNYSERLVLDILKDGIPMGLDEANPSIPVILTAGEELKNKPNIVFVQLESFIDPTLILELVYSADPVPNFHSLKEKFSTGFLRVPAVGAGTANTEFEILTGMRIMSFGPGEYPYKTILRTKACESINTVLRKSGYASHAIHNHRGAFYGRNEIFANLGFDTFTSVEYMNKVKKTPKNWAKDSILTGEIMAALNSTEERDFIFAVSVQGHGKYPENKVIPDEDLAVHVTAGAFDEDEKNAIEYYVQQIYEMDEFIGDLTDTLKEFDERTVVVFYGDHLPVLNLSEDRMANRSIYETEYLIWANFDLRKIDENLAAYQLYSRVLEHLGVHNGIFAWYHQTKKDDEKYLDNLETLQYDMLYGANYAFGGSNPFEPTDLKMGVRDIRVDKIFNFGNSTYVVGENFTPYSKVAVGGDYLDTVFINPKTLKIPTAIKSGNPKDFSISQVGKNKTVLSTLYDVE